MLTKREGKKTQLKISMVIKSINKEISTQIDRKGYSMKRRIHDSVKLNHCKHKKDGIVKCKTW